MSWDVTDREGRFVEPRKYTTGKTQDMVAEEIESEWRKGKTNVVLEAEVGSGKSLIALTAYNIYAKRHRGQAIFIVPTRPLQRQYFMDYDAYNGRFKVGGITVGFIMGMGNFICPIYNMPVDQVCGDMFKNLSVREKLQKCPLYNKPLRAKSFHSLSQEFDMVEVGSYTNEDGDTIVVYRRDGYKVNGTTYYGCPYYSQFENYLDKDVIVLNADIWRRQKYLNMLPRRVVDVYDEFDVILTKFLPRVRIGEELPNTLYRIVKNQMKESSSMKALDLLKSIQELKYMIRKGNLKTMQAMDVIAQIRAIYDDMKAEFGEEVLDEDIEAWILHILSAEYVAKRYSDGIALMRARGGLFIVMWKPAEYYGDLFRVKGARRLFMSATPPPRDLMRDFYGIEPHAYIKAEVRIPGKAYLGGLFQMYVSGREFRINHEHRVSYTSALYETIMKARSEVGPRLGVVVAKKHIEELQRQFNINLNVDEDGTLIIKLRQGLVDEAWSTRAMRGVSLENVHGIIITKYPYPDLSDPFWQILQDKHPGLFRALYDYVARASLKQAIARALRDDGCWVVIYSPDAKVRDAVLELADQGILELHPYTELKQLLGLKPKVKIKINDRELIMWRAEWESRGKPGQLIEELEVNEDYMPTKKKSNNSNNNGQQQ